MKVLAIGAHPDDIEIYMFGTLAACRERGDELVYAVATDGSKGGTTAPEQLAAIRAEEARAAAALLRAEIHLLGFGDGNLASADGLAAALEELIDKTGPDLILTHAANDYHADHRALSHVVSLAAGFRAPLLYCDTPMGTGFAPTHYVDTTIHFEAKCAAIRCHISQDPERYVDGAKFQDAFRSGQCNTGPGFYAEAFRFEPRFPFADVRDLLPPAPPVSSVPDRARTVR